jgi:hypothetical protein
MGTFLVETAYRYEEVICEKMINCTDAVELRKKRIHFYKARCKLGNKISQIKVEISNGGGGVSVIRKNLCSKRIAPLEIVTLGCGQQRT